MIFYADLILNADLKCLVEQDRSMNAAIEAVAAKIMGPYWLRGRTSCRNFHEVSKPQDWMLKWTYRSEISQVSAVEVHFKFQNDC